MHHRGIQHIISALIVTGVVTGLRFSPREMSHRVTLSIGMECKNRFFNDFFMSIHSSVFPICMQMFVKDRCLEVVKI